MMSHFTQHPKAKYPDVRYRIGTLPDGTYHVWVYGLADDFDTRDAEFLAAEIERRLDAGLKLESAKIPTIDEYGPSLLIRGFPQV